MPISITASERLLRGSLPLRTHLGHLRWAMADRRLPSIETADDGVAAVGPMDEDASHWTPATAGQFKTC